MKSSVIVFVVLILSAISITGFAQIVKEQASMKPITSVQEGVRLVDSFKGKAQEFVLAVPDSLLDSVGVNMAIITDRVLARGWQPDGFTQAKGHRIFRYKELKQCNR